MAKHIISDNHPICHLEVLNVVVALSIWAPKLICKLVHLFCDNAMAVNVFQAGCSKDQSIQVCARQLWLLCTTHDITLAVGHIVGEPLTASVDAPRCWHLGQCYSKLD